jgi:hypothetical protein
MVANAEAIRAPTSDLSKDPRLLLAVHLHSKQSLTSGTTETVARFFMGPKVLQSV